MELDRERQRKREGGTGGGGGYGVLSGEESERHRSRELCERKTEKAANLLPVPLLS